MAEMLFEWIFTSIFLILVVLALRAALGKRMSAGLRYGLWAVVLVRLLVPVQLFTSPLAGTRVFSETRTEFHVDKLGSAVGGVLPSNGLGGDEILNALGGQDGPSVTLTTFPQAPNPPAAPGVPEPPAAPDLTRAPAWLGWTWLAGSAAVAFVLLLSNLRFFWTLRRERIPMGSVDCPLRVYAAMGLPSPCLFGLFRPAIYVTPEAAADPNMLRHVLAHEYTHYKHGDHLWSLLRCAALAAHWWNPLVWLAAVLSQRDAELACDEGALKRLGDGERAGYGNTLLALVTAKPRPGDLFRCATTMAGDKKSLKERITRIARAPQRILWTAAVAVLVTALACMCAFGQAAEEPEDGPEPPVPSSTPAPTPNLDLEMDGKVLRDAVTLDAAPDLNRNGVPETLIVGDFYWKNDLEQPEEERTYPVHRMAAGVEVWEDGRLLWTGLAPEMSGGDSFLLYSRDGEDYLMEFDISGHQGQASGNYRLFTLENGAENTVRENRVTFDYFTYTNNSGSLASVIDRFDPAEVAAFVDEVDGLLADCTLLADTGCNYQEDDPLRVDLTWLEGHEKNFWWDDGQSTLENLTRFKLWAAPAWVGDLNRNKINETISVVDISGGQRLEVYEDEKLIWSEEGYYAHAGWNAIFLCTLDNRDYLLRYHPTMYQGYATYRYQLFTLENGQETVIRENGVDFDLNFHPLMHQSFDPEAIAAFMDKINGLLANSVQLLNTDEDLLPTFEKNGRLYDNLGWLDNWRPVFIRNENKSLLENLSAYQKAMERQNYTETPEVFPVDEYGRDIRLSYQDKAARFAGNWDYHFQPPEHVEPAVVDLDGDGREEIVVILVWGHGTGCSIENIYIFDADTLEQYDTADLNQKILDQIQSTGDEDNFYLSAPWMEQVTISKRLAEEGSGYAPIADALALGEIINYSVENGRVVCRLGCDASGITTNYIGCLDAALDFTPQGGFRCVSGQYIPVE